jgi:hypothetical protein
MFLDTCSLLSTESTTLFIRYVELSGMNLDSDFYIFRPIFRSKCTCKLIYKNKKLSYTAARESIVSRLRFVSKGLIRLTST